MAGSVNKVILIGNFGEDPVGKQVGDGEKGYVCNGRIATNKTWTDQNGEKQEATEWHRLVCWGPKGKAMEKYFHKGRQIYVEGELRTRSWDGGACGKKHYQTEIYVLDWQFTGSKSDNQDSRRDDEAY